MSSTAPAFKLRCLTTADIPAALRLSASAGWNQTDVDWRNLLNFEPLGCFAASCENGTLLGTATTACFDPPSGPRSFAWIGMMLVDPTQRRRGVGSALLEKCIEYLEGLGVETIKLDATPLGKEVYDRFGFCAKYTLGRFEGAAQLPPATVAPCAIEPLAADDLEALASFDAPIFGARRKTILKTWRDSWPECALAARVDGALAGFAMARRGARFSQIGPVIGTTPEICGALLCESLRRQIGANVIVDVMAKNAWALQLAERFGLRRQRSLIRMFRGPNLSPGRPESILAICCPELG